MNAQIEHNFKYHPPTGDPAHIGSMAELHASVRKHCQAAAEFIDANLPAKAGREKALAITKLEEAMMWACAGIARHSEEPKQ